MKSSESKPGLPSVGERDLEALVELLKSELVMPMSEIQVLRTVGDYIQIFFGLPEVVVRQKAQDKPVFHKRIPDRDAKADFLHLLETRRFSLDVRNAAGAPDRLDEAIAGVVDRVRPSVRPVEVSAGPPTRRSVAVQYVSPLLLSDTAWKLEIFSPYLEELRRLIQPHLPEGPGISHFAVSILFREERGFGYLLSDRQERELAEREGEVRTRVLADAETRFGDSEALAYVSKRFREIALLDLLKDYRWARTEGIISRIGDTALSWYIENYFTHEWRGALVGDFYIISLAEYHFLDEGNVWYGIPIFWRSSSYDPSPRTLIGALQFVGPSTLQTLPPLARVRILNVFNRKLNELHVAVDSAKTFYNFELKERQLRSHLEARARFSITFFRNFRHLISGKLPVWISALEKVPGSESRDALVSMKKIDRYFQSRQDMRKLELKGVDVGEFLTAYEREKKMKFTSRPFRIEADPGGLPKPARVLIIENELHDLLDQLVDNSVEQFDIHPEKAADQTLRIRITATVREGLVVIECADNAGGFAGTDSDGEIDQIFEDYYSTKGPGRGIGLTLCRDMAATYGGTVTASNVFINGKKHGARFVVVFPLAS